jgi:protein involved in polysaccharide export with SLBB domain
LAGAARVALAQDIRVQDMRVNDLESRSALEDEARKAEAQHRTQEAWLLKTRLQRGDFQDGDRIFVMLMGTTPLPGTQSLSDTITVRAGKMLPLPQMSDLPLEGVLRSELAARLSSHIAKYLRDSSVRVVPLLRLAVFGQVRSPGYYWTATDVLLSEVIMKAGGPGPTADMENMQIRRGADVIWNAQDTRTAMSDGLSLDRLHLRAGDVLFVADQKTGFSWVQIAQVTGSLLSVAFLLKNRF